MQQVVSDNPVCRSPISRYFIIDEVQDSLMLYCSLLLALRLRMMASVHAFEGATRFFLLAFRLFPMLTSGLLSAFFSLSSKTHSSRT